MQFCMVLAKFFMFIMFFISFQVAAKINHTDFRLPQAKLQWEYLTFGFGEIPKGIESDCKFRFINISDEPLVIVNVKTSCSCIKPAYLTSPIIPSSGGEIVVKFIPRTPGQFSKSITVIFNNGEKYVLQISGEVVQMK